MTAPQLPQTIGGYQHLAPYVEVEPGDIFVQDGKPVCHVGPKLIGKLVAEVSARNIGYNVYRKIPCPRQGGDRPLTQDEKDAKARGTPTPLVIAPTCNGPAMSERFNPHNLAEHVLRKPMQVLPTDAKARKATPIATGVLDYFPKALAEVARVSLKGNEQHHPGEPLHWDKSKSTDESDALIRHFMERGKIDTDGMRHSAKVAWRSLALLERELEAEGGK